MVDFFSPQTHTINEGPKKTRREDFMKKPSLITRIRNRLKDRKGQSTTEYVLILAIVVMMVSKMKSKVGALSDSAFKKTDQAMQDFDSN